MVNRWGQKMESPKSYVLDSLHIAPHHVAIKLAMRDDESFLPLNSSIKPILNLRIDT
jgi:hypothetical protein